MCVIDLEPCDVWREHKARKTKRCSCCRAWIEPGTVYWAHFSVYAGEASTGSLCEPCFADRETFTAAHELTPGPTDFWRMLCDCIVENDEDDPQGWKAMQARIVARNQAALQDKRSAGPREQEIAQGERRARGDAAR